MMMTKALGYAEMAMSDIESFEMPEGFETLAEKALFGCPNLTKISLPSTFKNWGHDACGGCDNLQEVHLHEEITSDVVSRVRLSLPSDVKVYWGNKRIPLSANVA